MVEEDIDVDTGAEDDVNDESGSAVSGLTRRVSDLSSPSKAMMPSALYLHICAMICVLCAQGPTSKIACREKPEPDVVDLCSPSDIDESVDHGQCCAGMRLCPDLTCLVGANAHPDLCAAAPNQQKQSKSQFEAGEPHHCGSLPHSD